MLAQDEIQHVIDAAINKRDKALIALLWDIGARIGEIGNLRIKDVKYDDIGISILVSGKTGQRRVRAVWSVITLKTGLKNTLVRMTLNLENTTRDLKKSLMNF